MALSPTLWLTSHGGDVKLGSDQATWFVLMGDEPRYSLRAVPVQGKFGCTIRQTNNGRRLPSTATFATQEEAIKNGLDELGRDLGWL